MKKLILFILLSLCVALQASAWNPMITTSGTSGTSAACDQSQDYEKAATTGNRYAGSSSANVYLATRFRYTGTTGKQICQIDLWLFENGTALQNGEVSIWSDSTNPGSVMGGTSTSVDLSTIGTSEVKVSFLLPTPSSALTNGSDYWIVLHVDGNDASNYIRWTTITGATNERMEDAPEDLSAWSYDAVATGKFELFSK